MAIRLALNLGTAAHLSAGQWCRDGETRLVCCPLCGTVEPIDPVRHVVNRAGSVTPAWSCPACPFLDWIDLEPEPC